ncbi:Glyoxalase-like domain protein [Nocardioides dokdonensis FR1436]|uniref:Glyoxalase-like domain protein n=1 Tax=Nocardioides dokdonensis FR1436 TaxID=1300347 RepID=A0A1A9GKR5_9ACTN|nr:VOC family protein [Nocardioides dokdonensis]ANH38864.1 Glyoxalase-like domain protein [Nocardioides dokdonensis FR1436]
MDQRLSFVTLAVDDLDVVRRFYLDGLGWQASFDGEEVLMLRAGPLLVLSLWRREAFEAEVGPIGTGPAPVTLAHNVATRDEVDRVLAEAHAAGASLADPPAERIWGGYTGYFTDPAGYRWEVAWNPGPIGQEVLP